MQRGHTKGFYFNSSYRKAGGLKTLFHGLFHHKHEEESDNDDYAYRDSSPLDAREIESARHEPSKDMKKEAS
jgi:hypothetical protein